MNIYDFIYILKGAYITILYSVICILIGLIIGSILAYILTSNHESIYEKIFHNILKSIVSFIRGTPLLLQIFFFTLGLPGLLGINMPMYVGCLIALSLNSASYSCEIIRSGILSVLRTGQIDSCISLSMTRSQYMRYIVMPQVFITSINPIVNEIITLIKETALIGMVGEMDIMYRAKSISVQSYDYVTPLICASIIYYCIVIVVEKIGKKIENYAKKIYKI